VAAAGAAALSCSAAAGRYCWSCTVFVEAAVAAVEVIEQQCSVLQLKLSTVAEHVQQSAE
jgi:hypothetical protein